MIYDLASNPTINLVAAFLMVLFGTFESWQHITHAVTAMRQKLSNRKRLACLIIVAGTVIAICIYAGPALFYSLHLFEQMHETTAPETSTGLTPAPTAWLILA